MQKLIAPAVALAVFAASAAAQEAAKPGPEHQRLGYFAGTWTFTGTAHPSPMGPGGELSGTDTCEWFAGGFQLVCRGEATSPRGDAKTASVWTWDLMQGAYTFYGYSSLGDSFYVPGSVDGKVWTWQGTLPMGGTTIHLRAVVTEEPPAAYSYKFETSLDGASWTLVEEGRATKTSK